MKNAPVNAEKIIRQAEKLFHNTERNNAEESWDLITEFMLNNQHSGFTGELTPGAKRTQRVYDSTAMQAAHDLSAAIHSVMTNPAAPWMALRYIDDELNNDPDAVAWLQDTSRKLMESFNSSNFTNEVSKGYKAFTTLGNMCLMHEEDNFNEDGDFGGFRFKALHLSQITWTENAKGLVDTLYRKLRLTARQAFERWDKDVSDDIKRCLDTDPEKEFDFVHCIMPRELVKQKDVKASLPKDRPFASLYIESKTKNVVEEGGYYEFPAHVVRWETQPHEVYGRGPGHIALPDVRTLNRVKELGLHAINKAINPPLLANQRSVLGSLDLRPGHVTVVKELDGIRPLDGGARFDVTQFAVEDLKMSIRQIFFLDKLTLPPRTETGEMTAFEVSRRIEEMNRALGPTLGRLNSEMLDPLVRRAFNMMLRGNAFLPVPESVANSGTGIQIEYVNPLARSQRISEVSSIQSWVQDLAFIAQVNPAAIDYIDGDGIAKLTAKIRGVPEAAVMNDEEVAQMREQRAAQLQQEQQLEQGVKLADMESKLSRGGQ